MVWKDSRGAEVESQTKSVNGVVDAQCGAGDVGCGGSWYGGGWAFCWGSGRRVRRRVSAGGPFQSGIGAFARSISLREPSCQPSTALHLCPCHTLCSACATESCADNHTNSPMRPLPTLLLTWWGCGSCKSCTLCGSLGARPQRERGL